MSKPQQIIELEEELGFELREVKYINDALDITQNKTYLLNENKELIALNLFSCMLKDVHFLKHLTSLIYLNLGWNNISNLFFLENLVHLRKLYLNGNCIKNTLILNNLKKLEELKLDDNQIVNLSLSNFARLESLSFSKNPTLKYLTLEKISKLISVDICEVNFCRVKLENLESLTKLCLIGCQITNISFLKNLTSLAEINLSGNKISDVSVLGGMFKIRKLHLNNNQISDISVLNNITDLLELNVKDNQLTSIYLDSMPYLNILNVSENPLERLFLNNLPNIRTLDLNSLKLKEIKINGLDNLHTLLLSNNKITDISFLAPLLELRKLNIKHNKIRDISILKNLVKLTSLDFSYNQILGISLSFLDCFPNLKELILHDNPIENIPPEILNRGRNVLEDVRNHLEALEEDGKIPNDQIKMLLLGNSTAGKTSLINFLQEGEYVQKRVSTHGIENLIWQPFKDEENESETIRNIKVSVWDFGGQEFYHNTHSLFFSDNAIYLVLFEEKTNHQGKKNTLINLYENGIQVEKEVELEHFEYSYWLENVKYLTQTKNKTSLLIQNKCDVSGAVSIDEKTKQNYGLSPENKRVFYISVEKAFEEEEEFTLEFKKFKLELFKHIKRNIATFDK